MFEFDINYRALNSYEQAVNGATFAFLVLPAEQDQQLLSFSFWNSLDKEYEIYKNPFGFKTIFLPVKDIFSTLEVRLHAQVRRQEINPFDFTQKMTPGEEWTALRASDLQIDHHLFLRSTPLTRLPEAAAEAFPRPKEGERILDFLLRLSQYLHEQITFRSGATDTATTAEEAWSLRQGVCQDYTHIFIAAARLAGIPARYVSGYLCQNEGLHGDAQMHAWAEAFLPGIGWKGFDASNNLLADHFFIKVAHGNDYSYCTPVKGVLYNTGKQQTSYAVEVVAQ